MPWEMVKITEGKNKGKYRVRNKQTGKVHAKATSKANAEAQLRLLRGVEHGMVVRGR
jgi:hypothetical protein